MNGQQATHMVVINQNERAAEVAHQINHHAENVASAQLSKRQFLVPEFKVSVVKRNRSFELGYN